MTTTPHVARTLDEALDLLADGTLAPLAGGTWVMRAPPRGEPWAAGHGAVAGGQGQRDVPVRPRPAWGNGQDER
ncbi:hypothetical protein [Streptomyces sp. H51]|uniref:hypothetical protein n=1 Tax=Streptomyces sp. H51 TaxID=3111770 RepID=UPI002D795E45|nr:hypothetical protein [Streptomyces sp. H51]